MTKVWTFTFTNNLPTVVIRKALTQDKKFKDQMELRPYQKEAIQNLRIGLAAGYKRQVLVSATGSGKTLTAASLIKSALAKGKRVAFLCNRIQLVNQTAKVFASVGIPFGIIQGDNTTRTYENVLIASIHTVAKRGMPKVDIIITDEGHAVAGSKEYRKLVFENKEIPFFALTATPWSKGMAKHYEELDGPLFENVVVAATIPELIRDGYLVDCDVYGPTEPDMTGIKMSRNAFGEMDYSDMDVGRAVDKPEMVGDIVKHWMRLAKDTKTVVFAANIAHSKHIVEQFIAAGVRAIHIDCYQDSEDRDNIIKKYDADEYTVISNAALLGEGWDSPSCRTLILARPTKSRIRFIQICGRVFRIFPGKERSLIIDHSGTVSRLGFPTDEQDYALDDGKPKQATKTDKKAEAKLPTACPSCSFLKKTHQCPVCSFAPERKSEVEMVDGELSLLKKKGKLATLDKRNLYAELLSVAKQRKWSEGRLSNVFRDITGVWPNSYKNEIAKPPSQETLAAVQHLNIKFAKSSGRKF